MLNQSLHLGRNEIRCVYIAHQVTKTPVFIQVCCNIWADDSGANIRHFLRHSYGKLAVPGFAIRHSAVYVSCRQIEYALDP